MYSELDARLSDFLLACKRYSDVNRFAVWVYYAISRYICSGRASADFCRRFLSYPEENFDKLIDYALRCGGSDNDILRQLNRAFKYKPDEAAS